MKRRPRLTTFDYRGVHRYFLTLCTAKRHLWFANADIAEAVLSEIRNSATKHQFAILAYCFMPDHLHLLVEGLTEDADLTRFVKNSKQRSGYAHKQRFDQALWQPSWFDRVLREEEQTHDVIRYILLNPVRAGLVVNIADYPLSGSDVYPLGAILEDVMRDVDSGAE
jgi:putative transposase